MKQEIPERENNFAMAPHAIDIMPEQPAETKAMIPHATNVVPPESEEQKDGEQ